MTRTALSLTLILGFVAAMANATTPAPLWLHENWQLETSAKVQADGKALSTPGFRADGWLPITVPNTVLGAQVEAGLFPDPYYGNNLKDIPGFRDGRWMVMPEDSPYRVSWWYRTEFLVPADAKGQTVMLQFDGINYEANIWLNGRRIADRKEVVGMFRRFEFNVTGLVKAGQRSALAVEIFAPARGPDIRYRTKQIEATTGWDDHNPQPPDANMGIWEDVRVRMSGPVTLRHAYVRPELAVPGLDKAWLFPEAQLNNTTDEPVEAELTLTIGGISASRKVELAPNESKWIFFTPESFRQLIVHHPRVWWPNPAGAQELYGCDMTVHVDGTISDTQSIRFGIRKATTTINDEGWRAYWINGEQILIRGGAWMTSDMLLRLSRKRYDGLVRYAKEANLNMLRSEGFSIRETDEFYNLCDEYGVMITQQIFGRNIKPESLAVACIEDMILRIRNHPSLVHLLGHDETFPTPTLDVAYRQMIERYMPDRTYQPHSGAFDIENRFITGGTRTGTRELWTYADPTRYYLADQEARAWGFAQSGGIGGIVAPMESVRRMIPEAQRWPLWTEAMSFHTVIQGGDFFATYLKLLNHRYGPCDGIEEFCEKSQLMNYESARAMYEAYGREKYKATGLTTWKYDNAWPAFMTWNYVDWYQIVGGAYYGAKKACESLHVQYSYDDHSIWVINGLYQPFINLKVTARIFNMEMTEAYKKSATVNVGSDGKVKALGVEFPSGLSKSHFLALTLEDAAGRMKSENLYWLSTTADARGTLDPDWENFNITPRSVADHTDLRNMAKIALKTSSRFNIKGNETSATVTLENPSDQLAFFVHLAVKQGVDGSEVAPTFWEDNYLSLLPGRKRTVTGRFYTSDLAGADPVVVVDGWNVK